jgi:predicted nucleotidyltransferase
MIANSLDLSGKVDPLLVEALRWIKKAASGLGLQFFIVGATARNLVLELGFGVNPARATRDADIIPFGPIARPGATFSWPSDPGSRMNVLGFDEAYASSLVARIADGPPLEVHISAPQGLAILKLISWDSRDDGKKKDAQDFSLVMHHYLDLGNADRVSSDESDLLNVTDFDYEEAGARLLGRDMAFCCAAATARKILEILIRESGETGHYRLVISMGPDIIPGDPQRLEKALLLLNNVRVGFEERMKRSI